MADPRTPAPTDDSSFRNSFAAALATVLRENDDEQQQQSSTLSSSSLTAEQRQQLAIETYQLLCHDDPVHWTAVGCHCLAEALMVPPNASTKSTLKTMMTTTTTTTTRQPTKTLALSNRLVQGIQQVVQKRQRPPPSSTKESSSEQQPEEILETPTAEEEHDDIAAARAMAHLAWTVHIQIPQACLLLRQPPARNQDMIHDDARATVTGWLGSYRAPETPATTAGQDRDDIASRIHQMTAALNITNGDTDSNHQQRHELLDAGSQQEESASAPARNHADNSIPSPIEEEEEVWAAESDPSDFAYESGYDYQAQLHELDAWAAQAAALMDPIQLSQSSPVSDWTNLGEAIRHLLQTVSYSPHLVALPDTCWQDTNNCWTLLILTLLVPSASPNNPLLTSRPRSDWQHTGLHVLHLLRDVTLDGLEPNRVSSYLDLLRQLLEVEAAEAPRQQQQRSDQADFATSVAPAAWIGVSLLSALCSTVLSSTSTVIAAKSQATIISLLQAAVLQSCDELALLLERAGPDVWTQLQWTYLSFFQILSVNSPHPTTPDSLQRNNYGQTLLQSGLFRQWLLHWSEDAVVETSDTNSAQLAVQDCLLDLCAASPALLGKYAWRFPNFAWSVTRGGGNDHSVDRLLWNLLGVYLSSAAANDASSSRMQWKSKNVADEEAKSAPPTTEECQQAAWLDFQALCDQVHGTVVNWKKELEANSDSSTVVPTGTLSLDKSGVVVANFGRLVSRLSNAPLLSSVFVFRMAPSADGKSPRALIETAIKPIREVLQEWPVRGEISDSKEKIDNDEQDEGGTGDKHPTGQDGKHERRHRSGVLLRYEAIQGLRRDVKALRTVLLDEDFSVGDPSAGTCGAESRQIAGATSSKAD